MFIRKITTNNESFIVGSNEVTKISYFKDGNYYNKGSMYCGPSYVVYKGDVTRVVIPEKAMLLIEIDRTEEVLEENNKGKKLKKVIGKDQTKTDSDDDEERTERSDTAVKTSTFEKLLNSGKDNLA